MRASGEKRNEEAGRSICFEKILNVYDSSLRVIAREPPSSNGNERNRAWVPIRVKCKTLNAAIRARI